MKQQFIGFDRIRISPENITDIKVMSDGTETLSITNPTQQLESYTGNQYYLKGLTSEMREDLLKGHAFLEFRIKAVDMTKPTGNNRLYTKKEMLQALNDPTVIRGFNNGGIPAEVEHPYSPIDLASVPDNPKPIEAGGMPSAREQAANMNKLNRLLYIDSRTSPHFVYGFEMDGDILYLKIRTSINNKQIVNDILAGRLPTFSIRTIARFIPNEQGQSEAHNLKFITTDYVWNPAVHDSRASENVKLVYNDKAEIVDLKLLARTGTESDEEILNYFNKLIPDGYNLGILPELGTESLSHMVLIPKNQQRTKTKSFEDSIKDSFGRCFGKI